MMPTFINTEFLNALFKSKAAAMLAKTTLIKLLVIKFITRSDVWLLIMIFTDRNENGFQNVVSILSFFETPPY